jgi:hypothetical protein
VGGSATCVDGVNQPDDLPCGNNAAGVSSVCSGGQCTCGCKVAGVCQTGNTRASCGSDGFPCSTCPIATGSICDTTTDPGHPFCDSLL